MRCGWKPDQFCCRRCEVPQGHCNCLKWDSIIRLFVRRIEIPSAAIGMEPDLKGLDAQLISLSSRRASVKYQEKSRMIRAPD